MPWINGEEVSYAEAGVYDLEDFFEAYGLNKIKANYWRTAEQMFQQPDFERPELERDEWGCLWIKPNDLRCPHVTKGKAQFRWRPGSFQRCKFEAGRGTVHEGIGRCTVHMGKTHAGAGEAAVLVAMLFAEEMQVTPWEALLQQVRLLYNQVKWLQLRVTEVERQDGERALLPGGSGWEWVLLLESRGDRLAKVSKMAIDAGIAQQLVRQVELEAENMVLAAVAMLDQLGITGAARDNALETMGRKLMELESGQQLSYAQLV